MGEFVLFVIVAVIVLALLLGPGLEALRKFMQRMFRS
nr:hypothetical protein BDOA9_0143730 [Bradyrhizobium sp. DOA9]